MKHYDIRISKFAEKQLRKIPKYLLDEVQKWIVAVKLYGIYSTRKNRGYHDEPLKGLRWGQRSVRLNRSYRLIYSQNEELNLIIIIILEVNKHDY